jgi:hypothetical protein
MVLRDIPESVFEARNQFHKIKIYVIEYYECAQGKSRCVLIFKESQLGQERWIR